MKNKKENRISFFMGKSRGNILDENVQFGVFEVFNTFHFELLLN